MGQTCIARLSCADDDAQGQTLEVLWDYELDRLILDEEGWAELAAKGFDQPRQFGAFLHTLRWNCVTATDPNLFQAPFRAGIKIDAYQMEPLRKALRLPRVNLFIADDTGLGKTIEAGLIARELLLRKKAKTIVVATPPSVLEQWRAELRGALWPRFRAAGPVLRASSKHKEGRRREDAPEVPARLPPRPSHMPRLPDCAPSGAAKTRAQQNRNRFGKSWEP
jgi:SNF2 family DNA or RNA helicase